MTSKTGFCSEIMHTTVWTEVLRHPLSVPVLATRHMTAQPSHDEQPLLLF